MEDGRDRRPGGSDVGAVRGHTQTEVVLCGSTIYHIATKNPPLRKMAVCCYRERGQNLLTERLCITLHPASISYLSYLPCPVTSAANRFVSDIGYMFSSVYQAAIMQQPRTYRLAIQRVASTSGAVVSLCDIHLVCPSRNATFEPPLCICEALRSAT